MGAFLIDMNAKFLQTAPDAQADLSNRWAYISEGTFSHITAQRKEQLMTAVLTFNSKQKDRCYFFDLSKINKKKKTINKKSKIK